MSSITRNSYPPIIAPINWCFHSRIVPPHPSLLLLLKESINDLTIAFTELKTSQDRHHESFLWLIQILQIELYDLRNLIADQSPQSVLSGIDVVSLVPTTSF